MLGVSSGNAAPALEVQEGIFHEMAHFIEIFVIFSLFFSVSFWRYFRLHSLFNSLFNNGIRIIALIGQQVLCAQPIDKGESLCAICNGTRCNKDSDRQTNRIHGQMYLGVEPPFVRSMSWFPPFAPAA